MKKLFNVIGGIIASASLVAFAVFLSILIYNELPNFAGILISAILIGLAAWLGSAIFKKIQRKGLLAYISVVFSSPDLDNLEPSADSKTKKRTPAELAELFKTNQNLFKGGSLKIFGDWFEGPYQSMLKIASIDYNEAKNEMRIGFSDNSSISIEEPGPILESPTILRILTAKEVRLDFQHKEENSSVLKDYFKLYQVNRNKLDTTTNIDWFKPKIDASVGQDALILFS